MNCYTRGMDLSDNVVSKERSCVVLHDISKGIVEP